MQLYIKLENKCVLLEKLFITIFETLYLSIQKYFITVIYVSCQKCVIPNNKLSRCFSKVMETLKTFTSVPAVGEHILDTKYFLVDNSCIDTSM